jgi:hypothetical protein
VSNSPSRTIILQEESQIYWNKYMQTEGRRVQQCLRVMPVKYVRQLSVVATCIASRKCNKKDNFLAKINYKKSQTHHNSIKGKLKLSL